MYYEKQNIRILYSDKRRMYLLRTCNIKYYTFRENTI